MRMLLISFGPESSAHTHPIADPLLVAIQAEYAQPARYLPTYLGEWMSYGARQTISSFSAAASTTPERQGILGGRPKPEAPRYNRWPLVLL
jgi:hypothetical protein